MAGYSATPLPAKLGIVGDAVFTVVGAPEGFAATLGDYGDAIWQQSLLPPLDVVLAFFTRRDRLIAMWPKLTTPMAPAGAVWVAWPKKASGVPTDLTEDVLSAVLLPTGWVDNKVCAIDETWSGLRFVLRKELRPGEKAGKRPGEKHPGEKAGRAAAGRPGKRPNDKRSGDNRAGDRPR